MNFALIRHFALIRTNFSADLMRRFAPLVLASTILLASERTKAQQQAVTNTTPVLYSQGDPTNDEQYLLQLLNRARMDPVGEGQRLAAWLKNTAQGQSVVLGYGVDPNQIASVFAAMPAVPPLAFDPSLLASSTSHAADIAAHGGVGPAGDLHAGYDGSTPESRVQASGCPQAFAGENADSGFSSLDQIHAGYLIDWGVPDLAHRQNRMTGLYGSTVIGIGLATMPGSPLIEIEDFGSGVLASHDDPAMLTGVVYSDNNANGQYDPGEGIAGVKVTMSDGKYYALTSASGGYALPLVNADGSNVDGTVAVEMTFPDGGVATSTAAVTRYAWSWGLSGTYRGNVEWNATAADDHPLVGPDPALPYFKATSVSVAAGGAVSVKVFRPTSSDLGQPYVLDYIAKGSAVAGTDYVALSLTATVPAGKRNTKIEVEAMAVISRATTLRLKLPGVASQGSVKVNIEP